MTLDEAVRAIESDADFKEKTKSQLLRTWELTSGFANLGLTTDAACAKIDELDAALGVETNALLRDTLAHYLGRRPTDLEERQAASLLDEWLNRMAVEVLGPKVMS